MRKVSADERGIIWSAPQPGAAHSIIVHNVKMYTFRGIHWQTAPHERAKEITVLSGAARIVTVHPGSGSPEYRMHELFSGNKISVSRYEAVGYLTLASGTTLHYKMDVPQYESCERGIRFDDPFFKIDWKANTGLFVMNDRDRSWPDFIPGEG